jgi:hypothetical protein
MHTMARQLAGMKCVEASTESDKLERLSSCGKQFAARCCQGRVGTLVASLEGAACCLTMPSVNSDQNVQFSASLLHLASVPVALFA